MNNLPDGKSFTRGFEELKKARLKSVLGYSSAKNQKINGLLANYPRTHGLELPPTPSAVELIAKVVVADAEAGRGGAPNNQGIASNAR